MHSALSTRLALYFGSVLLLVVGLLLASWWFGIPGIGNGGALAQRQAEVQRLLEQRADFLRQLTVQGLAQRRSAVASAVQADTLVHSLQATPPTGAETPANAAVQRALNQWLNQHAGSFQHARVVRLPGGRIVASTNPAEVGYVLVDSALLERAQRPGVQEMVLPLLSPNDKPALAWVRKIRTTPAQDRVEVVGLVMAYAEVQSVLEGVLQLGSDADYLGQTLLYDGQQGVLAAVPARTGTADLVRLDADVSQGFEGSLRKRDAAGDSQLAVYRAIPLGGTAHWALVQLYPEAELLSALQSQLLRGAGIGLVTTLLLGVLLWPVTRLMTRRLLAVSAAFDRLARGEWSLRLPLQTHDSLEVVTLTQAFNHLAIAIQHSNATLEQQVRERTAELQAEHDRAQGYLDVAAIMLLALDAQGRISMINRKGAELLGYPAAQLLGMDWYLHFVAATEREERRSHYLRLMRGETSLQGRYENDIVDANGQSRLIAWNATLLRDAKGQPCGILSSGQDVTEARAAQAELRVAAIAFESQEAHMVCDANWVILRVNQAFTQVTGFSAAEAIGKLPQRLLGSTHTPPEFYLTIDDTLLQQGRWQGEIWDRRKSGEVFPAWVQITAVRDDDGHLTHFVVSMDDITQRKADEEQIRSLAFYDPLTQLPNRRLLMDRLEVALATCARHPRMGALLFVDLDNFKTLNDTLGHDIGDLLLQQVAERLKSCVREGDTVARLGGDEFVIMLEDLANDAIDAATQAEAVGEKILQTLGRSYVLRGHTHRSTPSIGVTLFGDRVESIEEPLKRADVAMYQSKAAGRNALRFFDPGMQAAVSNRVALEADLRDAIAQKQFVLHFQPQIQAKPDGSLRVVGAEALVRWQHPERGMVSPAEFIPLAEETGLIVPLGQWVLESACRQLARWQGHPELGALTLAVNVSARQFLQNNFVAQVGQALEATGARPSLLKLELTESTLVGDINEVVRKMTELQSWGVGFALDDFGTGYSSLAYLKRMPLDTLKIDQSFVRDVFEDANDAAIARMVVVLGRSLGLTVIAEGVETLEQRYFLAQQGCHVYQGYLFGKPQPVQEFQQMVLEKTYVGLPEI